MRVFNAKGRRARSARRVSSASAANCAAGHVGDMLPARRVMPKAASDEAPAIHTRTRSLLLTTAPRVSVQKRARGSAAAGPKLQTRPSEPRRRAGYRLIGPGPIGPGARVRTVSPSRDPQPVLRLKGDPLERAPLCEPRCQHRLTRQMRGDRSARSFAALGEFGCHPGLGAAQSRDPESQMTTVRWCPVVGLANSGMTPSLRTAFLPFPGLPD